MKFDETMGAFDRANDFRIIRCEGEFESVKTFFRNNGHTDQEVELKFSEH